ncbi:halocyanin domain-containing protein [Salinibaculum rarum]|uniref:halocyanin domain-containing protein n=1 Tax=Salinibaculum rarum TaxID=3058903 RepID=UPI00265F8DF8|nr:halocyanin domain-containing protein [Salinibaculum sp. KK48]
MDERQATRRHYLLGLGTVGTVGLAGCIVEDETLSNVSDSLDSDEDSEATAEPTASESPTEFRTETQPDFGGHLDAANNYDGTVVDMRGRAEVRVAVGAGSGLAFDPAAIHVDTGTTVIWEWTGEGGAHNIVAEDGSFDTGTPKASGAFEYTFVRDGIYNYHCVPHEASGMLGSVVVGNSYPTRDGRSEPTAVASEYLGDANNYDGFVDARGHDEVNVTVGAGNSGLAFDPPAVHVDPRTTVIWEWLGDGGAHNVVAEDDSFSSGNIVGESGHTFERSFVDPGLTRYHCVPHEGIGMKGAVLVGGDGPDSYAGTYDSNGGSGPDFGGYLDNALNYDGSVTDMTGYDEVPVEVGAGDNGLGFGPAAVRVDPGTTVVWVWTGEGGAHNVVAEDGRFESPEIVSERGTTYEFTFEEAGICRYYCVPHKAIGMKGVVVVGTA